MKLWVLAIHFTNGGNADDYRFAEKPKVMTDMNNPGVSCFAGVEVVLEPQLSHSLGAGKYEAKVQGHTEVYVVWENVAHVDVHEIDVEGDED